jgi:phosphate transport system permease protein
MRRRAVRAWLKPILEILAGVPTVVYGYFAALTVAPGGARPRPLDRHHLGEQRKRARRRPGHGHHDHPVRQLDGRRFDRRGAAGDARRQPGDGRDQVGDDPQGALPAALPGVVGGVLLAVSRAIGETMIVVMAAGLAANLTANPFASVTTVTTQIVQLLTGDQEFDSAKTLAAFALGLVLFLITLLLNLIALRVVRKYREAYE